MLKGIIIKNISNSYTVRSKDADYICVPRGIFRHEKKTPLVGDRVLFDEVNGIIEQIIDRSNELLRPNVANVDVALLVTSLKEPNVNFLLLDKEICAVIAHNVEPVICTTKLDLLTKEEYQEYLLWKSYYQKMGIYVFENTNLNEMKDYLKGKSVVLTGQSGAGKSSLLNRLDPSLELKTDTISYSLNRGKHTTRHTEMFDIDGIYFFDTPGFSSLTFEHFSKEDVKKCFIDFNEYSCQYRDCFHENEKVCGVKEAYQKKEILASRYENYLKILRECQDENIRIILKK